MLAFNSFKYVVSSLNWQLSFWCTRAKYQYACFTKKRVKMTIHCSQNLKYLYAWGATIKDTYTSKTTHCIKIVSADTFTEVLQNVCAQRLATSRWTHFSLLCMNQVRILVCAAKWLRWRSWQCHGNVLDRIITLHYKRVSTHSCDFKGLSSIADFILFSWRFKLYNWHVFNVFKILFSLHVTHWCTDALTHGICIALLSFPPLRFTKLFLWNLLGMEHQTTTHDSHLRPTAGNANVQPVNHPNVCHKPQAQGTFFQ